MTPESQPRAFPLAMASEGAALRVVAIEGGSGLARRLSEMGLNVGAEIKVCQRQGGGLVVQRGETRFALGGGMAHRIFVCEQLDATGGIS